MLLVEDDDIAATVFEELLADSGVSVLRVRSAEQALAALRRTDALSVVWADLDLGERLDGVTVLQAAEQLKPDAVRVLVTCSPDDRRIGLLPKHTLVVDKLDVRAAVVVVAAVAARAPA